MALLPHSAQDIALCHNSLMVMLDLLHKVNCWSRFFFFWTSFVLDYYNELNFFFLKGILEIEICSDDLVLSYFYLFSDLGCIMEEVYSICHFH